MQGFPAAHSVLLRSLAALHARDPSHIDTSLPVNSIPVVGPLASPLVGGGANSGQQPPTSPGNPSSSNPPPGPTSTVGDGDSNGNGGGNNPTNSPMPTSGGPAFQPETTPVSAPGNPSSSSSAQGGNSGSSTASSLTPGDSGSYSVSSGQVASAMGGAPSSLLAMSLDVLATNALGPSQSSLGSGSSTVGAFAPSSTTTAATSVGERLSGGTIAGITIACLFSLLALILLVFRRQSIGRRVALRNKWWFNHVYGGGDFSSVGRPPGPMNTNGEMSPNRLSARSSFATNFDQGLMFRIDPPSRFSLVAVPDYPPMAEVRERNSVLISTEATVAKRNSLNNMLTHGSDLDTRYLAASTSKNNLEPMSVRPFSPSESFFFPKPPAPSSTDTFSFPGTQEHTSSLSSATTLVQVSTPAPAFMIDLPPTSAAHSQYLIPNAAHSPLTAAANTSPDPFADPVKPFAEVEVIRRPFAPSLDDELMVYPGDHVRILQMFDDGWTFVEKLAGVEGKRHELGLIPLDCLRETGHPLPTFLSQKRVSYGSDRPIGYAL